MEISNNKQKIKNRKVVKIIISIFLINMIVAVNVFAMGGYLGDFTGDGNVDGSDLSIFAKNFGSTGCQGFTNIRYVGYDETIQSVINSITDASADMPYTIFIPTGVYDCTAQDLVMKEWVHLRGLGSEATIIVTANYNNIIAISNSSISDMTIEYTGSYQGAITKTTLIENFTLDRVNFNIYGSGAAVWFNGGGDFFVYMNNVKIVTEGKGIYVNTYGHYYLHDVDIFLTGDNIGSQHIGIQVDSYSRFYIWGSKIGTGYGYPNITNDTAQDVIGIYIPVTNTANPRIELHDLESFCRNEGAQEGANVNVIRAENGWFRCFGCFGQAETPPDWSIGDTLYQSGNGKIEIIGCRFSNYTGNVVGSPQRGVSQYTVADHNYSLDKFEGGLILLDATDGAFTLRVPGTVHIGSEYIFKKIDSTVNVVTISGNGNNIDGQASVSLTSQYETLKIIAGPDNEWYAY